MDGARFTNACAASAAKGHSPPILRGAPA